MSVVFFMRGGGSLSRCAASAAGFFRPPAAVWPPTRRNSTGPPGREVRVFVRTADGGAVEFAAPAGMSLMEAMRDVGRVDVEAACDGTCACSTCHVILRAEDYARLGEPCEDEMDMLDLAPSVTKTSRLACQVRLAEELDGMTVRMPPETANQLK